MGVRGKLNNDFDICKSIKVLGKWPRYYYCYCILSQIFVITGSVHTLGAEGDNKC